MAKELLTDRAVRNAKPRAKPYRLADGGALYLLVATTGAKSWQVRYRLGDKQQTATLGKYPDVTLKDARTKASDARNIIADGGHVTTAQRVQRVKRRADEAQRFKEYAESWVKRETKRAKWTAPYVDEVSASIRRHLSKLDALPLHEIKAPVVAPIMAAVERAAPAMAEKIRRRLRGILDTAVEDGLIAGNPLPQQRRGPKVERRHFPAVVDLPGVGAILRDARAADPSKGIARAHLLAAFTAQRISEVVGAKWDEFDLKVGVWAIPRERMKRKDAARGPHLVPLTPRLLAMVKEWREADDAAATMVCVAPRDPKKNVTPEGVEKFYRDRLNLAGEHSPHSWRSVFKSTCADAGKDRDLVESQCDRTIGNKAESAYDRADRLARRRDLMTWYEATLIAARDGAQVVKLHGGAA